MFVVSNGIDTAWPGWKKPRAEVYRRLFPFRFPTQNCSIPFDFLSYHLAVIPFATAIPKTGLINE